MENKETSIFSFKENLTKTPSEVDSSFTRHHAFYVLLLNIASTYVISTILSFIILAICSFFHLNDNIANSISQLVSTIVTLGLIIPLMYKTIASDAKVFSKKTWLVLLLTLGFFVIFYVLVSFLYTDLIEKNIIQLLVKHNIISSDTLKKFPTSINQIEIEKMLKDNTALIISIPSILFTSTKYGLSPTLLFRSLISSFPYTYNPHVSVNNISKSCVLGIFSKS